MNNLSKAIEVAEEASGKLSSQLHECSYQELEQAFTTFIDLAKSIQECKGLPEKRNKCILCDNNGIGQETCCCFEVNQAIDLCTTPYMKRVEEIKDLKKEIICLKKEK